MSRLVTPRRVLIAAIHCVIFALSYVLAFELRFDFEIPRVIAGIAWKWMPWAVAIQFVTFAVFRLYHGSWRYVGVSDVVNIARASIVAGTLSSVGWYFGFGHPGFPRSVFILHAAATLGFVALARLGIRVVREIRQRTRRNACPVLIVGAGDAGETLVREIHKHPELGLYPVGFVDDNPAKRGSRIHDVPVLGDVESLPRLVHKHAIQEILIACPSATNERMRRIVGFCKESEARFKTLPGLPELIDGRISLARMREVKIEDLLGRGPVQLDMSAIAAFVADKVVLVTGAGGSIGSELARQIATHRPRHLVLLDRAEHGLYHLLHDLGASRADGLEVTGLIGDVTDSARIDALFRQHRPALVFHAAAHKHVPLMEDNLGEAVKNNVIGTATVADAAARHGASTFVMISTDKAVLPTSVMGATKRAAERYVRLLSQRSGTKFLSVRFGNVLGSAGSVVPLFTEQIKQGGPVTVTHPEMERYFMTIPEAVQLVLQGATMGTAGEVFILEMGTPVKIVDLARDLISLSGFEPDVDVAITFTGCRPGEKLREELVTVGERVATTRHPKILIAHEPAPVPASVARLVEELRELVGREELGQVRRKLHDLVPEWANQDQDSTAESAPPVARVIAFPN